MDQENILQYQMYSLPRVTRGRPFNQCFDACLVKSAQCSQCISGSRRCMCAQKIDESLVLVPVSGVQCSAFPNLHRSTRKIFHDIPTIPRLLNKRNCLKWSARYAGPNTKKNRLKDTSRLAHRRLWWILCYQSPKKFCVLCGQYETPAQL